METLPAFFAEQRLATTTAFYANAAFRDAILLPTLAASAETADSSELFLRSYRLLAGFALAGAPDTVGQREATFARGCAQGKARHQVAIFRGRGGDG